MRIGDAVEVTKMEFRNGAVSEIFVPATVCCVSEYKIGVAYADSTSEMFPTNSKKVRSSWKGGEA